MAITRAQAKAAKKAARQNKQQPVQLSVLTRSQAEAVILQEMNAVIAKMDELRDATIEDNRRCGLALGRWDLTQESQWQAMFLFYKHDPPVADITTPEGALIERNRAFLVRMHQLIDELYTVQYGAEALEEIREMRKQVQEKWD